MSGPVKTTAVAGSAGGADAAKPPAARAALVIKLGGAAMERAAEFAHLFRAIVELHQREQSRGGGLVLVHGGGAAVDRRLERLGLASQRREGIRITTPEQIDEVVAVLAGVVNKSLVGELQREGAAAVGLCLGDGKLTRTVKASGYSFDPGCVGEIVGGDAAILRTLLAAGFLPVLSSIGLDAQGRPLNVNADDAAASIAALLGARGLVLLTDVPGVMDGGGRVLEQLTAEEIEARISAGEVTGGMIPKVRGAIRAAAACGAPVTIAAWNDARVFARLAMGESAGTRVLPPRAQPAEAAPGTTRRGSRADSPAAVSASGQRPVV